MKDTSTSKGYSAEPSPEGHWSKNFAALSVHRRKDWVATAKGFNKYVWDFENKPNKENIYGLYASHGALLIANNETLLSVHDVDNGWDWAKVPGTTSIALDLADMDMGERRFFGKKHLAGGLTFKGTCPLGNGVFGMNFGQPSYGLKLNARDWRRNIVFQFKKSFFFFENLIVGLGSHISAQNTNNKIVQTTLFQDKLFDGVASSKIKVNGVDKTYSDTANAYTPNTPNVPYTTLTDAKGNFYYIPSNSKMNLNVHLKDQNSKTGDGRTDTRGRYATAWFDHSTSPNNAKYEYAVLIPTATYNSTLTVLATAQESANDKVYKVLKQDRQAHVVQFVKTPKTWCALDYVVTGYVLFRANLNLPREGEIAHVTAGNVLLVVEKSDDYIFLSVSVPSLNLHTKGNLRVNKDVQQEERYQSSSQEKEVEVTLRTKVESSVVYALAHGNPDCYKPNVWVVGGNLKVKFLNLKNGFSVEVKLKKMV